MRIALWAGLVLRQRARQRFPWSSLPPWTRFFGGWAGRRQTVPERGNERLDSMVYVLPTVQFHQLEQGQAVDRRDEEEGRCPGIVHLDLAARLCVAQIGRQGVGERLGWRAAKVGGDMFYADCGMRQQMEDGGYQSTEVG